MPKKPKVKVKKVRAVRQPRQPVKKPSIKQIVNVYTDRQEPYSTDFKNQFRYGLGNIYRDTHNPFSRSTSTANVENQSITEDLKVIPVKELTSQSIFQPFAMPVGIPKKKIMIGEEIELKSEFLNIASNNPYSSESEGGFASPRKPRADVGKPRGSYKEKAVIEGRNIQNVFALGASSGGERSGEDTPRPVYTTSKLGTSNY
jgi:hypothetical protein